jgi:HD superfamily phosphohydrolase
MINYIQLLALFTIIKLKQIIKNENNIYCKGAKLKMEQEYVEFFQWLFDKENIEIKKEIDVSSCLEKEEPYIYYTKEIKDFFNTKAMKRLENIGQLANASLDNPNAQHTRLEHCKGAYQKMLEFYMIQYKKSEWKETHSDEQSRLKVLADIMDMASHDIGHNVCSHALEKLIGTITGAHEILGNRILHENQEVVQAIKNIHPELLKTLDKVKEKNYGLKTLKEGNIDFDRADFLVRDSIYLGVETGFNNKKENTKTVSELIDKLVNNCEIYKIKFNGRDVEIPVFSYEVELEIGEFLARRSENYEHIYRSIDNKPKDILLEEFCRVIIESDDIDNELKTFLTHISETPIDEIDLDEFLAWDDIRFYNSVFDIIENSENEELKMLAKNCLPNRESLVNVVYQRLMPKITPKIDENGHEINIEDEFESKEDRKFYLKVKRLVKDEKYYSEFIQNKNLKNSVMSVYFETSLELAEFLEQLENNFGIKKETIKELKVCECKIKKYNKDEPIFIRGKDGKIYTFDEYPERTLELNTREYYGIVGITSEMALKGINESEIEKCRSAFEYISSIKHNIDDLESKSTRLTSELHDIALKKSIQYER